MCRVCVHCFDSIWVSGGGGEGGGLLSNNVTVHIITK